MLHWVVFRALNAKSRSYAKALKAKSRPYVKALKAKSRPYAKAILLVGGHKLGSC